MQLITKRNTICENENNKLAFEICKPGRAFFDIETTGFSATTSTLYLIGVGVVCNSEYEITQFFADSQLDEKEVLSSFFEFLEDHAIKELISFNGLGFDVPYVNNRCMYLGLNYDLSNYSHLDIYKIIVPQKKSLGLYNCRQKTVEQFLKLKRDDVYDGGQLIQVYKHYTRTLEEDALDALLLHNYEDVLGMLDLLPILSYSFNLNCDNYELISVCSHDSSIQLSIYVPYLMPKRIELSYGDYHACLYNNLIVADIMLNDNQIKMYYEDYKNYYYLGEEDVAIHKSLAQYVDKSHREKATALNCYSKINYTNDFFESDSGKKYISNLIKILNLSIKKK